MTFEERVATGDLTQWEIVRQAIMEKQLEGEELQAIYDAHPEFARWCQLAGS